MISLHKILLTGALTLWAVPAAAQYYGGYQQPVPPTHPGYMAPGYAQTPPSAADLDVPQVRESGGVSYITGGIGDEEKAALDDVRHEFNVRITNANRQGEYTADNNITIRNARGDTVLSVTNGGPLFYAKLPPGRYTIDASAAGQEKVKQIRISRHRQPVHIHFVWQES